MARKLGLVLAICFVAPLCAQTPGAPSDEPLTVSTDHPRLLLRPPRLRLLKRERERRSARWDQVEALVAGNAPLLEPGFAKALYYQISGDGNFGRQAVAWAMAPGRDLRQVALVFDWCQDVLTETQRRELMARLEKALAGATAGDSIAATRNRVLAAIALYDHVPDVPQRELERVARNWWGGKIVPALAAGQGVIARDDAYALFELLHAMRDNTNLDLREMSPQFFKDFPMEHLLSYYPAAYPAAENDYYIGSSRQAEEPDLQLAALSRASEMAMVAYDTNAPESQLLQGWLMHDRFMLKGTFGAPYEFLWANPYQPGLSYNLVPMVYHNATFGKLFVRSSWDESARWFGYFDGAMQIFEDGHGANVDPRASAPLRLDEAVICFGRAAHKFVMPMEVETPVFIVGLEPRHKYIVEVDDEEMFEAESDPGGILEVAMPKGKAVGVRIH